MRKLTALAIAVGLGLACPAELVSQPPHQARISVEVRVLPYTEINLPVDKLVMNPVTRDMFEAGAKGEKREILASTDFEAWGTVSMQLKAPLAVILSGAGGSYEAEVGISLPGENINHTQDSLFQYIDLEPGLYSLVLEVKIDKVWTPADTAGTYTGAMTLEIYSL